MSDRQQQIREELAQLDTRRRRLRKELRGYKAKALGHSSKPRTFTKDGHEYLDWDDALAVTRRRLEIYHNACGEAVWFDESDPAAIEDVRPAICQGCAEAHLISWNGIGAPKGEWHHNVKSYGGRRCDCAACALYLCPAIHEAYRGKVIPILQREAV